MAYFRRKGIQARTSIDWNYVPTRLTTPRYSAHLRLISESKLMPQRHRKMLKTYLQK